MKTQIELLLVIGVVGILGALILPMLGRSRPSHFPEAGCQNNLKQIGLSFATWAADNGERFPMQVPIREGGTMEIKTRAAASAHFLVMSNELSTPRVLLCPADMNRRYATNFGLDLQDSTISYFVSVDAQRTNYSMVLAGDRNVQTVSGPRPGMVTVRSNTPVTWGPDMHHNSGYLLLVDGSVHKIKSELLTEVLSRGFPANHLAIP